MAAPVAGVYRATVTRTDGPYVWVSAPRLARDFDYGPLEAIEADPALDVGDRVLVTFLEGLQDTLIVLGRIAS